MSTPAIIWIVLCTMGMTASAMRHGKPKEGKHDFFPEFIATSIIAGLLYWGGFFS